MGFANFLLRLFEIEQPRAVLVGWDTLDSPNYRQRLFPAYQSGRVFDQELLEQLQVLPAFVTACGFVNAKASGYEADDFLAAAVAEEERRRGIVLVASGDRDAFQLASAATTILHPVRAGEMARIGPAEVPERYGVEPRQVPVAHVAWVRREPRRCCTATARWNRGPAPFSPEPIEPMAMATPLRKSCRAIRRSHAQRLVGPVSLVGHGPPKRGHIRRYGALRKLRPNPRYPCPQMR